MYKVTKPFSTYVGGSSLLTDFKVGDEFSVEGLPEERVEQMISTGTIAKEVSKEKKVETPAPVEKKVETPAPVEKKVEPTPAKEKPKAKVKPKAKAKSKVSKGLSAIKKAVNSED